MALTANAETDCGGSYELDFGDFFMAPSITICKGAALTIDAGRVRPLTTGAGKKFIGFAMQGKTTTAGMTFEKIDDATFLQQAGVEGFSHPNCRRHTQRLAKRSVHWGNEGK